MLEVEKKATLPITERRKDNRSFAPMTVVIGNTPYAIENWSFGGIKISNYYGTLQPPKKAQIKVLIPTTGPGALFQTSGEAKRYDPCDVSLSMAFDNLDMPTKETLNRYFLEQIAYDSEQSNRGNNDE
ncbi:MAG: hypothetical protein CMM58_01010 [Rhodospirillaceae bacterium]|nr:hypothetical protein [Rhodospirillaceae bacterium]|tara:strand:+ start:2949 stop:3332 length:384 start_codon:yes stop_codon:yes gene_type:complete